MMVPRKWIIKIKEILAEDGLTTSDLGDDDNLRKMIYGVMPFLAGDTLHWDRIRISQLVEVMFNEYDEHDCVSIDSINILLSSIKSGESPERLAKAENVKYDPYNWEYKAPFKWGDLEEVGDDTTNL